MNATYEADPNPHANGVTTSRVTWDDRAQYEVTFYSHADGVTTLSLRSGYVQSSIHLPPEAMELLVTAAINARSLIPPFEAGA